MTESLVLISPSMEIRLKLKATAWVKQRCKLDLEMLASVRDEAKHGRVERHAHGAFTIRTHTRMDHAGAFGCSTYPDGFPPHHDLGRVLLHMGITRQDGFADVISGLPVLASVEQAARIPRRTWGIGRGNPIRSCRSDQNLLFVNR